MPCAPHINSIANTYRTLRTMRAQLPALAAMAIGTTSSLLPSVGIVSTLAGCARTLHSLASDCRAVTCAIMKPEFTPASAREKGRQSFVEIGMYEPIGMRRVPRSLRDWSVRWP